MIKLVFISLFLCHILCAQDAISNSNTLYLVDYLKSKYLGKKISITYKNGFRKMRLKVINVIEDEKANEFKLLLSDKSQAKLVFETSTRVARRRQLENSKKENLLKINTLKSQELINFAIKDTLDQSGSTNSSSSSLKNLEENMDSYFSKNHFTTSKEIIYTDLKSRKIKEDIFVITTKGLFLNDGRKISIAIRAEE